MNDLIERQDAINALVEKGQLSKRYKLGEFWELNLSEIKEALDELPSVELECKKGTWIDEKINSYTSRTYCSECGSSAPFVYKSDGYYGYYSYGETAKTKFCPNCGADMRGEGDFVIECETYDSDEC